MKKLLLLILAISVTTRLSSQDLGDLIITQNGDSIRCKIDGIKDRRIYILSDPGTGIQTISYPVDQVKSYKFNYFSPKFSGIDIEENHYTGRHLVLYSIGAGYGYHYARLSPDIPQGYTSYYQKLKSGLVIHADVTILSHDRLGLGFKFHRFSSSNELQSAKLSDDLRITLVAPSLKLRTNGSHGGNLFSNYYLGYLRYLDASGIKFNVDISGATLGLGSDFGYELEVTENFMLNIQASFTGGILKKYKVYSSGTVSACQRTNMKTCTGQTFQSA